VCVYMCVCMCMSLSSLSLSIYLSLCVDIPLCIYRLALSVCLSVCDIGSLSMSLLTTSPAHHLQPSPSAGRVCLTFCSLQEYQ
jgi:hypothetical protein